MNVGGGYLSLQNAFKDLRRNWEEAQLYWSDSVQREFAEEVWAPLEAQVAATLREMDRLAQTFARAEAECA